MDDGLREVDSIVPINTLTPSQENEFVQTMDKYISNSYSLYDSNTYILLYVSISFNAIMIVNILLQILFWTLSISCKIYNSSKIDGSSYPYFYNKILFHFRSTHPRNLTDDNLHSYVSYFMYTFLCVS